MTSETPGRHALLSEFRQRERVRSIEDPLTNYYRIHVPWDESTEGLVAYVGTDLEAVDGLCVFTCVGWLYSSAPIVDAFERLWCDEPAVKNALPLHAIRLIEWPESP